MLAYDYPLLDVFMSMLFFALFVVWLILLVHVLGDLFRDDEESGWAKAAWVLFLVVFPYIGVLAYIVARGHGMGMRTLERAQAQDQALQSYVAATAGPSGTAEELAKLADLRDRGVLTQEEFDLQKAKILG
jgi:uncharacterized SAM-binding protein YcdF (DUF218 family)